MQNIFEKKLLMLKPENLIESQNTLRKNFNQTELGVLAESIKINGIIAPLAVKKTENKKYEILAGNRRLRAAKIAGIRRIPCIIYSADEQSSILFSLAENLQRKNLNIFEELNAIECLINLYGLPLSQVAMNLGFEKSSVEQKLKLLNLSEDIRQKITASNLTEDHAKALLKLSIPERQTALDHIIENSLLPTESEQYISNIIDRDSKKSPKIEVAEKPIRKHSIGDIRIFFNSLSKLVLTLQSAGVPAKISKTENDKYIEYRVRIKKDQSQNNDFKQLKIC